MMLAAFSLASCSSDDDNEDKVEQVTLYVSAETGTYQNVPDNNYVEGMLIREQGESTFYCVSFQTITGFTYERGHEYELLSAPRSPILRRILASIVTNSSASCRIRKSNNINHS